MTGQMYFFGWESAKITLTAAMTSNKAPRKISDFLRTPVFLATRPRSIKARPPVPQMTTIAQLRLKKPNVSGFNSDNSQRTAAASHASDINNLVKNCLLILFISSVYLKITEADTAQISSPSPSTTLSPWTKFFTSPPTRNLKFLSFSPTESAV